MTSPVLNVGDLVYYDDNYLRILDIEDSRLWGIVVGEPVTKVEEIAPDLHVTRTRVKIYLSNGYTWNLETSVLKECP